MSSSGADVRDGPHSDIFLIGQCLDLGENLAPHRMAVVAYENQFELTRPLFRQQANELRSLAHESAQRLQFEMACCRFR